MTEQELANQVVENMNPSGVCEYATKWLAGYYLKYPEVFAMAVKDNAKPPEEVPESCLAGFDPPEDVPAAPLTALTYQRDGSDMDLPPDKTCGDCVHISRCTKMIGRQPDDMLCDWSPSRFWLAKPRVVLSPESPDNPPTAHSDATAREADGMPPMNGWDKLGQLHKRLGDMLANPNPGLSTWMQALSVLLMDMADYAGHGYVSAFPDLLEALREMAEGWRPETPDSAYFNTYAKAIAAIAQATGEPTSE